ncbi:MAG: beta-N-acetylhexosaminidase [Armatimonadetes bacterium]|nr:MAG: beta-N-acetylhexosaminidase [Armatimonadota bacterium]
MGRQTAPEGVTINDMTLAATCLVAAGLALFARDSSSLPALFPYPQRMTPLEDSPFAASQGTLVFDSSGSLGGQLLAERLRALVGEGVRLSGERADADRDQVIAFLPALPQHGVRYEGYRLTIGNRRIEVRYVDPAGALHAAQTLIQLLPPAPSNPRQRTSRVEIPAMEIADWPRFSWRGMHLDVSRHFFPVEDIKRYLDSLALHKMNVFHWHLTDDGGWRMQSDRYPKLTEVGAWRVDTGGQWPGGNWNYSELRFPGPNSGKKLYGGYYTKEQIRDIVKYAADRNITVVPEIEMPGHSLPALVAYPKLGCEGVEPYPEPGFNRTNNFCPGKDETLEFLEAILDETLDLFPSKFIHIGADEVWKGFWQKCPKCQERIRTEGLAVNNGHSPEENLQSWLVRRVESYLWRKGRRLVGWDEILEGGLAPGATVMSWRGIAGGIAAAKAGQDVVMSPTSHCYFDYSYETTPVRHVYSWDPVPADLSPEEAKHVLGGQANVWTEWIPTWERVETMIFPRMLATAEVLWTEKSALDWNSFESRLARYFPRLDAMGIAYHMPKPTIAAGAVLFDDVTRVEIDVPEGMPFLLRFTSDGSLPTGDSRLYDGPIEVRESSVLTFSYVNSQGKAGDPARIECKKYLPEKEVRGLAEGWSARLFAGRWSSVPAFEELSPSASGRALSVSFADPASSLESLTLPRENFALEFAGFFRVESPGVYTFSLGSDDGSVLWIAGAKLIDNDGLHGYLEKSASVALKPGYYPLRVGMFQAGGARSLSLNVEGPGLAKGQVKAWSRP